MSEFTCPRCGWEPTPHWISATEKRCEASYHSRECPRRTPIQRPAANSDARKRIAEAKREAEES